MEGSALLQNPAVHAFSKRLHAHSQAMLLGLETRLPRYMTAWLVLASVASAVRFLAGPVRQIDATSFPPYLLLILAPAASLVMALRWFARGDTLPQPARHLTVGQWRTVSRGTAAKHPLYGTSGFMLSLMIGILLNVPVLALEFLAILPVISVRAPEWIATLHLAMTFDVVAMSSIYVIVFVAALRRVPAFPRMLVWAWLLDIAFQWVIAVAAVSTDTPLEVRQALESFLDGNIKKTLISIAVWLPYLILSTRVNVTYRRRIPA